jgi:hypothetical protein
VVQSELESEEGAQGHGRRRMSTHESELEECGHRRRTVVRAMQRAHAGSW